MVSKSGLDPLVSPVIHCLYKEFSEKAFDHFHCLQLKNASPILATQNSTVHGVIANNK